MDAQLLTKRLNAQGQQQQQQQQAAPRAADGASSWQPMVGHVPQVDWATGVGGGVIRLPSW